MAYLPITFSLIVVDILLKIAGLLSSSSGLTHPQLHTVPQKLKVLSETHRCFKSQCKQKTADLFIFQNTAYFESLFILSVSDTPRLRNNNLGHIGMM